MKGHFSIKIDPYTEEVSFGNLGENGFLAHAGDIRRGHNQFLPELIAHDVVEHDIKHRYRSYVTYENELRALGAANLVRAETTLNKYSDILSLVESPHRKIKPVPKIVLKHLLHYDYVETGIIKKLIQDGITPEVAKNAVHQHAWGFLQKENYQNSKNYYLVDVFEFIAENINYPLKEALDFYANGVSIYFDYTNKIFRHRMIWKN